MAQERKLAQRFGAVAAGVVLAGSVFTGAAYAQTTTETAPSPTTTSGSLPALPSLPGGSSSASSSGASSSSAAAGAGGGNAVCQQLNTQLENVIKQLTAPTSGIPVLGDVLAGLQQQGKNLQDQLATAGCSLIPNLPGLGGGSQGGTATETTFPTTNYPVTYPQGDSGAHHSCLPGCDCSSGTPTPVAATQVGSVPKGGVDTGDGSVG